MDNTDFFMEREALRLSDGFAMDVFLGSPASGRAKGVIVLLSPIFGVDEVFARTVRLWAEAGYLAVAPDYFGRVFPGTLPHTDDGFRKAIGRVKAVDRGQMLTDIREIGRHCAKDLPLFFGGYCAGGEPVMRLALEGCGDGHVIFHAARLGIYADRLSTISKPMDLHFGGADPLVPMEEVEQVREGASGNPHISITIHPDAVHAFTQEGSRNYQAAAAIASFAAARRTLDQLARP